MQANIDNSSNGHVIGRIGGNIPEYFTDKLSEIEGLRFYVNFQNPEDTQSYLSVFVPEEYGTSMDNNIYPNCSVKVFVYPYTDESNNEDFTIGYINKSRIIGY